MKNTISLKNVWLNLSLILIVAAILVVSSLSKTEGASNQEVVLMGHASYPFVSDINIVAEKADLIVKGKYTGNREIHHIVEEGQIYWTKSHSNFKINKAYKGTLPEKEIVIVEPAYEENNVMHSLEGYTLMNKNDNYLLFLNPNEDGTYKITAFYQGQFNLDAQDGDSSIFHGEDKEHYHELRASVKKMFK